MFLSTLPRKCSVQIYYARQVHGQLDFYQAIDEIYERVEHVEPWMSGNARGPSTAFCLLYHIFTLRPSEDQIQASVLRGEPFAREAVGGASRLPRAGGDPVLPLGRRCSTTRTLPSSGRLASSSCATGERGPRPGGGGPQAAGPTAPSALRRCDPKQLWDWCEPYLADPEKFKPSPDGKTVGQSGSWAGASGAVGLGAGASEGGGQLVTVSTASPPAALLGHC